MANYVEVLAPIRPKNDANFPVVSMEDISLSRNSNERLSKVIGEVDTNLADYVKKTVTNEIESDEEGSIGVRLTAIEETLGMKTDEETTVTIDSRLTAVEEAVGLKTDTETTTTLAQRVATIETALDLKADTSTTNTFATRLTAVENALGMKTDSGTTTTLTQRVAAIETALDLKSDTSTTNTIATRLTAVEEALGIKTDSSTTTSLAQRVTNLESALGDNGSVDSRIESAITTEKNARISADNELTTAINTEVTNRSTAVTQERTNREAAIATLTARVAATETSIGDTSSSTSTLASRMTSAEGEISTLKNSMQSIVDQMVGFSGSSKIVDSISDMTDHNIIYILNTDGMWYTYDSTSDSFIARGNVAGMNIDSTLTQNGSAAEAATVGARFTSLESDVSNLKAGNIGNLKVTTVNGESVLAAVDNSSNVVAYVTLAAGNFHCSGGFSNDSFEISSINGVDLAIITDGNGKVLEFYDDSGSRNFEKDIYAPNINALQDKVDEIYDAVQILKGINSIQ